MTLTHAIVWPLGVALRIPIWTYRYLVSPIIGPRCRFTPTCSEYADEAIAVHGPIRGTYLAMRRIVRCHPWGSLGYDPVPPAAHLDSGRP